MRGRVPGEVRFVGDDREVRVLGRRVVPAFHDSRDHRDSPDNADPRLANEAVLSAEPADPTDPIESTEPTLPIDRTE